MLLLKNYAGFEGLH